MTQQALTTRQLPFAFRALVRPRTVQEKRSYARLTLLRVLCPGADVRTSCLYTKTYVNSARSQIVELSRTENFPDVPEGTCDDRRIRCQPHESFDHADLNRITGRVARPKPPAQGVVQNSNAQTTPFAGCSRRATTLFEAPKSD
jgi:hypothetical protein